MICIGKAQNISETARLLGRSAPTIWRELRRNPSPYDAVRAQQRAKELKETHRTRKLGPGPLRDEVERRLREDHSPWQIEERLKIDYSHKQMWVSHETIYRFVREALASGVEYAKHLRRGNLLHPKAPRGKSPYKRIRNARSIEERPHEAEGRLELGHFESDTVKGRFRSSYGLATHVDRKTRFLVLALLPDRKASTYNEETRRAFARHHRLQAKTFTVDNGMEFSMHRQMSELLQAQVFFAHSYSPWERGLNENTNGLLRQYFPKKYDLSKLTQRDIQQVEDRLNNRPRKCLGYRTPTEALQEELIALGL